MLLPNTFVTSRKEIAMRNSVQELHNACIEGNNDRINQILNDGVDVEISDRILQACYENFKIKRIQITPLSNACRHGHIDSVILLLNRGALVNNKFTKQSYTSPLLESAKRNDVDMTMLLISRGADTEFRDLHGRTVLFHAVITGSVDVMAILIKNGSNVNAVENKRRFTPLHFAYRLGYRSAIKILIEASADENARDYKGRSPGDVKNTKILPEKEYVD